MREFFITIIFILLVGSFLCCLSGCDQKSDEEKIFEFVDKIGKFAEKKDLDSIMSFLTEDYTDHQGRDRADTRSFFEGNFRIYSGIVFHFLSSRILDISPFEAEIESEVALSTGAAKVLRRLLKISLDNYRLKMSLIYSGESWMIKYAEWRYISLEELYPESYAILKKIFPGL